MSDRKFQGVVVVGTSCSGKTTFARKLARALNLTCIELDAIYWKPNWCPRQLAEFRALFDQNRGDRLDCIELRTPSQADGFLLSLNSSAPT